MGVVGTKQHITMPHDRSQPPDSKNPLVQAQWRSEQRAERNASKPDVWTLRKGVVFFVYGIVIWTGYVVIGRVAVPMLRRRNDAGGGPGAGAGIIVGYVILWLMFMWTYTMIVIVGPGFAKDHISTSEDPSAPHRSEAASSTSTAVDQPQAVDNHEPSELAAVGNLFPQAFKSAAPPDRTQEAHATSSGGPPADDATYAGTPAQATSYEPHAAAPHSETPYPPTQDQRGQVPPEQLIRPQPTYHVGPRWCRFCKIVKPDRTHHCRNCGTCVLLYDHHCPWIGQCVGWRNHKEFVVFCGWASALALYIFLAGVIKSAKTQVIDGQVIGAIAASALFGLFTFSMFTTHLTLIHNNTSTLESFAVKDQHERENYVLQREFGYCGGFQKKKQVRRRWKEEWGGVKVDGRWRTGHEMRKVMGEKLWMWFVPVNRPDGDGVHFEHDPRFGPNGEWLPKAYWPAPHIQQRNPGHEP